MGTREAAQLMADLINTLEGSGMRLTLLGAGAIQVEDTNPSNRAPVRIEVGPYEGDPWTVRAS